MKYLKSIKVSKIPVMREKYVNWLQSCIKCKSMICWNLKTEEGLELEARGISEDIRSDLLKIIDLVIEAKMEGMVAV